jgi:hypothetical protein
VYARTEWQRLAWFRLDELGASVLVEPDSIESSDTESVIAESGDDAPPTHPRRDECPAAHLDDAGDDMRALFHEPTKFECAMAELDAQIARAKHCVRHGMVSLSDDEYASLTRETLEIGEMLDGERIHASFRTHTSASCAMRSRLESLYAYRVCILNAHANAEWKAAYLAAGGVISPDGYMGSDVVGVKRKPTPPWRGLYVNTSSHRMKVGDLVAFTPTAQPSPFHSPIPVFDHAIL